MNAAEHYRQAAALFAKPTRREEKILARVGKISPNQAARNLIHRSEPAPEELYRGATLTECDWGPGSFQEFEAESQLSPQIHRLSQVAGLRIHHAFQQQETRAAVDDVLKLLKVARHIGCGGTFLFKITQLAVEAVAVDAAAAHLPRQDSPTLEALARGLEILPDSGTLFDTVQREKQYVLHYVQFHLESKTRWEVATLLRQMCSEEEVEAILRAVGDTKGLVRLIESWAANMDELGAILMSPMDQVHAALAAFRERHRTTNPVVAPFVRHTEFVAYAAARADARLAMLRAALAIVRNGTVKQYRLADAGSDGLFDLRRFKGGFKMRAHLPFPGGPPAILVVGENRSFGKWLWGFLGRFVGYTRASGELLL
jgi:hypothetical protein